MRITPILIKKHVIILSCLSLTLLLAIGLLCSQTAYASKDIPYTEYKASHNPGSNADTSIILSATDYKEASNDVLISDGFLLTGADSVVTYSFNVPKAGFYNISLKYMPVAGGGEIIRKILINSDYPFKEAEYIVLKRYYTNKNEDYKNQSGNQTFPAQVEANVWSDILISSADGFIIEPLAFYFEAGVNTLTIESVESEILMDGISLIPEMTLPKYSEYLQDLSSRGINEYNGEPKKYQGEDAILKSSPSLYPINDRSSPLTEPYHPSYIVLNTIGGYAWRYPGQSITWEVDAPETGLYKLAFKYKQAEVRGMFSTRRLMINGSVPFSEANDLRFNYKTKFSLSYLADRESGEEFFFYLDKGKNTITLEASLGVFADLTSKVDTSLANLNKVYQDIIVITSTSPDKYRDYKLSFLIPDLYDRLRAERDVLEQVVEDINSISGSFTNSTSVINMLIVNIDKMLEKPNKIGSYLADFKRSMTALGDWMISIQQQPLQIDYFVLASDDYKLPKAEGNFIQKLLHSIRAFIGSFTTNYNAFSTIDNKDAKTIEVWVSTGRDQYNVLQRLVNESFSKENKNINVKLKLVGADVIFPATLTGSGPDVNIQVAASTPINFGYRDGAYDLSQFPDFGEVAARFSPAAVDTFRFKDAYYAIPDQMSFNVMFYRTDIFNELGLELPKTLHDFLAIVPILQKNNMNFN